MFNWVREPLVNKLVSRFRLSDTRADSTPWVLSPVVIPTTNVDDLLRVPTNASIQTAIAADGFKVITTVPLGKRWKLYNFGCEVVSGTFTLARVDISSPGGYRSYIFSGGSVTSLALPVAGIPLGPGDTINVWINTFAVAGNLNSAIIYEESNVD